VAAASPTGVVVAWGDDTYGQSTVPVGLWGVTAISAGFHHSLALKSNGTVVAWGVNADGETNVPAGLSGVTAITAGYAHSLALKSNGTVVAWGVNGNGQTDVPVGLSGVTAIAAGGYHSLALKSDGTVVAWVPTGQARPTSRSAFGRYRHLRGYEHNLALKSDGTVVAWGADWAGQTDVPVGLSGVTAIAAGYYGSLALKSDGTVVGWGGTTVPADLSGVTEIAAGYSHSLALRSDGTSLPGASTTTERPKSRPASRELARSPQEQASASSWCLSYATSFTVSGIASPYVAGDAHDVTVTALDADGNVATKYRARSISPAPTPRRSCRRTTCSLRPTQERTPSASPSRPPAPGGTRRDTVASRITGVQSGIVVIPGPAQTFVVFGIANSYVAGAAHNDGRHEGRIRQHRYRLSGHGPLHLDRSGGVLPANYTFTAADGGIHRFSLALNSAGSQGVRARDTNGEQHHRRQVRHPRHRLPRGDAHALREPIAGVAHDFTVTAKDANGNTDAGYRGTMHFTRQTLRRSCPRTTPLLRLTRESTLQRHLQDRRGPGVRARDT